MEHLIVKDCGYDFITFKHKNFEVEFTDLGASIVSIKLDGKMMTLNPEKHEDFILPTNYHGKTIGRVCNRLPGNVINVDGKEYKILNNEGLNTLHGGIDGVSAKRFSYEIKEDEDKAEIVFKYLSKHLESGFPGNMEVLMKYIVKENVVEMYFEASTDQKTMCSLTNHAFYLVGEQTLDNLELMISSHKFLHPAPSDLLPVEIRDVNEIMDFSNFKAITKYIEDPYLINSKSFGYDHYFYFDKVDTQKPQCSLKGKKYQMDVYTDFSGLQIYSDNYSSDTKFAGTSFNRRRGIAIEPSESQKDLHFLDKDQKYSKFIKIEFKKI